MSSPQYIAREWACHAATSVGYEVAGRFVQVAECSGFGHPPDEDLASAAQIVAALNGFPELRAVNAQVVTALRSVTEMLNAARLIMTDDEARRMAGEAVNTAREIIRVAS